MPRREGEHMLREADEVFRLARKGDAAIRQVAVKQRADADGVARGDEVPGLAVIDHERKFRIQLFKHGKAVLPVQRQQDLAVGFALERVFLLQLFAHRAEAVQLAVADYRILPEEEGLHALRRKAHDGEAVEAEEAGFRLNDAGHVRPAGNGLFKACGEQSGGNGLAFDTHDGTHKKTPPDKNTQPIHPFILGRMLRNPRCHLIYCKMTVSFSGSNKPVRRNVPPPRLPYLPGKALGLMLPSVLRAMPCAGFPPSPALCDRPSAVLFSIDACCFSILMVHMIARLNIPVNRNIMHDCYGKEHHAFRACYGKAAPSCLPAMGR